MPVSPAPICLAVLNPGGRDPHLDYAGGPGKPTDPGHPPVNYHAYAAATGGAFFDRTEAVLKERDRFDAVLVLIRNRVPVSLAAIRELKDAGMTVLAAWKEAGPYQISDQLKSARSLSAYQDILMQTDGFVSPTAVPPPRWGWLTAEEYARKTRFIPTPYPVEFPDWVKRSQSEWGEPLIVAEWEDKDDYRSKNGWKVCTTVVNIFDLSVHLLTHLLHTNRVETTCMTRILQ